MKTKLALVAVMAMSFLLSCGDDEPGAYKCKSCASSPEALSANNEISAGIYKGVVVGSSGTLYINMDNADGDGLSMTLVIDGETYHLETEASLDGGFESYFYDDRGTETQEDDIRIGFGVNADGSYPGVYGVIIPGHEDVEIEVIKELSDALVMGFEGTYSGDASGTFNMVVRPNGANGTWFAVSQHVGHDGDVEYLYFRTSEGGFAEGILAGGDGDGLAIAGQVSGHSISGTWEDQGTESSGTWTGRRKL